MKTSRYFDFMRERPDRQAIRDNWILEVIRHPIRKEKQADGRFRLWGWVEEAQNRALRVILLEDGITIHNAFFDRNFREDKHDH